MGGCTTNKSHVDCRSQEGARGFNNFLNWTTIIDDGDNKDGIHAQKQFLFSTKLSTF